MEIKLNFVKLAGRWYAQLPDYDGDPWDLEMVEGADVLCDMLDSNNGIINATLSTEPFDDLIVPSSECTLDFINSTGTDGVNYRCREYKLDVWLCNVTQYVFGEFPLTIYIRV
jgi:hypothetical protein